MPSFYNAKNGITKIFAAEMLSIIAFVVSIISPFSSYDTVNTNSKLNMFLFFLSILFTTIFTIMSYLLITLGLKSGEKDHKLMKIGYYVSIVALISETFNLVIQLLGMFKIVSDGTTITVINSIFEIINGITQTTVVILVSIALRSMLIQRQENKLAKKAVAVTVLYSLQTFFYLILIVFQKSGIAAGISSGEITSVFLLLILGLVCGFSLVLVFVAGIQYLILLKRSKSRLA